jgi:hypothetical protein
MSATRIQKRDAERGEKLCRSWQHAATTSWHGDAVDTSTQQYNNLPLSSEQTSSGPLQKILPTTQQYESGMPDMEEDLPTSGLILVRQGMPHSSHKIILVFYLRE